MFRYCPLLDMWFANISSQNVACLFLLLKRFLLSKLKNFDEVQFIDYFPLWILFLESSLSIFCLTLDPEDFLFFLMFIVS